VKGATGFFAARKPAAGVDVGRCPRLRQHDLKAISTGCAAADLRGLPAAGDEADGSSMCCAASCIARGDSKSIRVLKSDLGQQVPADPCNKELVYVRAAQNRW